MDILFLPLAVASIVVVGDLAKDIGRSSLRWRWIAVFVGPLAIPLLYLVARLSAARRIIGAQRA